MEASAARHVPAAGQLELFGASGSARLPSGAVPTEVVAGVQIPAPRVLKVGDNLVFHAPPGEPIPVGRPGVAPPKRRPLPRAPKQGELWPGFRSQRPLSPEALALAPNPEQAAVIDRIAKQLTRQFQSRQPLDIGRVQGKSGPVERLLTPEDIAQDVYQVTRTRQLGLSPKRARKADEETLIERLKRRFPAMSPEQLDRFLYPKARKAVTEQVRVLTRPSKLPEVEQKILAKARQLREEKLAADPRRAALGMSDDPGEVFRRLAADPKFARVLRKEGGKSEFLSESGVSHVLGKGLPSAVRDLGEETFAGGAEGLGAQFLAERLGGEAVSAGRKTATPLATHETPLDVLLAKAAGKADDPLALAKNRLELALNTLTEKQREVLIRHWGLRGSPTQSLREIAADMKIHFTTVNEHYRTALKKIEASVKSARPKATAPAAPEAAGPAPRTPDLSRWVRPQRVIRSEVLPPRPAPVPRSGAEATLPSRDLAELGPVKYPPRPLPPRRTPPPRIYSGLYPALQRQALWYDLLRRIQGR